jgi:hypothetical protein
MLITFIENYIYKFSKEPLVKSIDYIAYIISWNVWQMDGLKGVVPNSCGKNKTNVLDIFGTLESKECDGCKTGNIKKHNGIYCKIKDWSVKDLETGRAGRKIEFIDLLKKH